MTGQFTGCSISVEVGGGLGFYQGIVKAINSANQSITLIKVFHNGKPTNTIEVTISAADILDLKILHTKDEVLALSSSRLKNTVCPSGTEAAHAVEETGHIPHKTNTTRKPDSPAKPCSPYRLSGLQKQNNNTISNAKKIHQQITSFQPVKTSVKPAVKEESSETSQTAAVKYKYRTSVGEALASQTLCISDNRNTYGKSVDYAPQRRNVELSRTPSKRQQWKNYRDETTFGTPIDDDVLHTEFDFEKNLALFDKQAVMEEIQSLKPDVVRQADRRSEKKYRCDENVITTTPSRRRQIIVPAAEAGEVVYATDNGLLVPSVTTGLRANLLSSANQHGLTRSRQLEMLGRAATEIILSVIGGSHRLEPGNSHQPPVVVLLCGLHMQGAAGTNCGRQLESHGVQTVVVTPTHTTSPPPSMLLSHETQLYSMTSGRLETDCNKLPTTVDLIVDARFDIEGQVGIESLVWVTVTNAWALSSRAPIVALDPPPSCTHPLIPRIRLCPALPLAYTSERGKVYLLNLNIPQQVFCSLGISYTPPFGAKMVIPLHPCE